MIGILTELGGLFNSFYLLGFVFTISFSYNLFLSSIIRAIYHFNARFPEEVKKKKKVAKKKTKKGDGDDDEDTDTDAHEQNLT